MRVFTLEQSKVSSVVDFTFYWLCVLFLTAYLLAHTSPKQLVESLFLVLVGIISWTAIEYLLHRFVLHGIQPFKSWHIEHHKRPSAPIFLPTLLSAALVLILVFFPTLFTFGLLPACAFTLGVLIGYLAYTIVHHGIHHWHINNHWFRKRKRCHGLHHRVDQKSYYGVTTSFWDNLFGSEFHR
jgi:sterol desaturase/sphingolipid hydroxylase (fatty acid hydroxylase superfamily)